MTEPINILHVVGQLNRGGTELRLLELMQYVDRRKYQFHFCCLSGRSGSLDEKVRAMGGEVHLIRRGVLGFRRRFWALLRARRYRAVESHVLYYSGIVLRMADQCGVPVRVALLRSSRDGRRYGPVRTAYHYAMRRLIDRHATHIAGVSRAALTAVWGQSWQTDSRCRIVHDGIDPADFVVTATGESVRREFAVPAGAPLYVHVGGIREAKNHPRLLAIFARLVRRDRSARLLLIGGGSDAAMQRLRQQVAQLGIGNGVVFCGERCDVPRLLAAADAMIFPSLWEGLPGAVLEASASGIPVLAADLPGIREIAACLPRVRCLSLDADDATWVEAARELSADAGCSRQAARRAFAECPFTIDQSATQHRRLWQDECPKRVDRSEFTTDRCAGASSRVRQRVACGQLRGDAVDG
ncbi:MAG: glycosyltransferase [Candidatus Nealsonbacteria bacterium]|nr:glycosyltransferase [Candidatus Nealsonbacteria bacterium]